MAQWFVYLPDSSETAGPFDQGELASRIQAGEIHAGTLVAREGDVDWRRAGDDPGIRAIFLAAERSLADPTPAMPETRPSPDGSAAAAPDTAGVNVIRRESISASLAIQSGIDRLRANPAFYLTSCLILALASLVPGVGYFLITAPLIVGFYQAVHDELAAGRRARLVDLLGGFRQIGASLVIVFWATAATIVGLVFCCIPGLVLLPVPFFAYIAAARDRRGGLHALTRALRVIEKDPFGFVAASVLLTVVGLSGMLFFYIGLAFTLPVMLVGYYSITDQMLRSEEA